MSTHQPPNDRCYQYVDAEWMYEPGREGADIAMRPLCVAVVNSNGVEFSFTDRQIFQQYLRDHWNDTWVAWGMQAEVSAMLAWGLDPPPNWIDLMVCYRWETNTIRLFDADGEKLPPTPSGLYDALDH